MVQVGVWQAHARLDSFLSGVMAPSLEGCILHQQLRDAGDFEWPSEANVTAGVCAYKEPDAPFGVRVAAKLSGWPGVTYAQENIG